MKGEHQVYLFLCIIIAMSGCFHSTTDHQEPDMLTREDSIPHDASKITPQTDKYPPLLHSDQWEEPVPVEGPINTAGAEDSPFMYGDDFYFFFTPDPSLPAEDQVVDGVTGIYVSHRRNGRWGIPEKVILENEGVCSLNGCTFIRGDTMWFCSAREGYTGVHWFTAKMQDGTWTDWEEAPFDPAYEIGELHITSDGRTLYFHSSRPGGKGGLDIWNSEYDHGHWQEPTPVEEVNTEKNEGWPFVTEDGKELWFTRTYKGSPAIFRSEQVEGHWQESELIISQFAGEPTLDQDKNIYFVHHFYRDGTMLEADIYVASRIPGEHSVLWPGVSSLLWGLGFIAGSWTVQKRRNCRNQ